ncbi:hypothetical protein E2C01_057648 [Portunus trituberculatus]|uniref:Uncharacterized protein n=1 Tax=Portunus trituberculatus TaxID=210409 RepID=A0A5B7H0X5_PORTR|nr:hypothetical protein [Portunus trituberculatus]
MKVAQYHTIFINFQIHAKATKNKTGLYPPDPSVYPVKTFNPDLYKLCKCPDIFRASPQTSDSKEGQSSQRDDFHFSLFRADNGRCFQKALPNH